MAKLNGKAVPLVAFDMVSDGDRLQVLLDSAKANADVRRPDGSKSATMLACEEVFRLQKELAIASGHNYTIRERCKELSKQRLTLLLERDFCQQSRWFRLGRWLGFYR